MLSLAAPTVRDLRWPLAGDRREVSGGRGGTDRPDGVLGLFVLFQFAASQAGLSPFAASSVCRVVSVCVSLTMCMLHIYSRRESYKPVRRPGSGELTLQHFVELQ
jgi:hypothetical protein